MPQYVQVVPPKRSGFANHLASTVDNILYGEGEGYNRSEAREAAAYRALTALMSYPLHR
jgi:hypothetical protein